jgi:hypothetical protein
MLTLIKTFLEKIDFLAIAEALRKRKNRRLSAGLYVVLVQSYEIIELYRILLDELHAALESHRYNDVAHRFNLNPARVAHLLTRQSSNLEVMETLTGELLNELRIVDNRFVEAYRSLFPGKFGILFEARHLLDNGRLLLSDADAEGYPVNFHHESRALSFSGVKPSDEERQQSASYIYSNQGKAAFEVSIYDGDIFFAELERYFREDDPYSKLKAIEDLTEEYRKVLLEHFSVDDLLGEIAKVRRHYGWAESEVPTQN